MNSLLGMTTNLIALLLIACDPVSLTAQDASSDPATADAQPAAQLDGPIRIAGVLWKANPSAAARTLSKTIASAMQRGQTKALAASLARLSDKTLAVVRVNDPADERFPVALASSLLTGQISADSPETAAQLLSIASIELRQLPLQVWLASDSRSAKQFALEQLAESAESPQWQSAVVRAILAIEEKWAEAAVLDRWRQLSEPARIIAIEPMSNRAASMQRLIEAIQVGSVDRHYINVNQLRKWIAAGDGQLQRQIESVWGQVRAAENGDREKVVARTMSLLHSGVQGSATNGKQVFQRVCSQCHKFRGEGFEVGPDITANGRGNLQQLVSNVLDPSLVIGPTFQAQIVLTYDGNVVAGVVVGESEKYLRLKVQGGKVVEFDKEGDIEDVKKSEKSLMPEGVESQMKQQELLDLFAYLCLLKPLGEENNELISGTPQGFVQP